MGWEKLLPQGHELTRGKGSSGAGPLTSTAIFCKGGSHMVSSVAHGSHVATEEVVGTHGGPLRCPIYAMTWSH